MNTYGKMKNILRLFIPSLIALIVLVILLHFVQEKINIIMSLNDPEITTTLVTEKK